MRGFPIPIQQRRRCLWAERLADKFHLLCFPSLRYHCHDLHVFQCLKTDYFIYFVHFLLVSICCKSGFRHLVMTESSAGGCPEYCGATIGSLAIPHTVDRIIYTRQRRRVRGVVVIYCFWRGITTICKFLMDGRKRKNSCFVTCWTPLGCMCFFSLA